jgi:hypothetical protein
MTRRLTVSLDAVQDLGTVATMLVGDDSRAVLALLMTATANAILDSQPNPDAALNAARLAGPALAEMVGQLAKARLAECKPGGTA